MVAEAATGFDFCLVAQTFVGGAGAGLGMAGVTDAGTSVVVETFSSDLSLAFTFSFVFEACCSSPFSFTAADVGGVDDTYVSDDKFGEATEASPALELATVVPFSEGEEGAVRARDFDLLV